MPKRKVESVMEAAGPSSSKSSRSFKEELNGGDDGDEEERSSGEDSPFRNNGKKGKGRPTKEQKAEKYAIPPKDMYRFCKSLLEQQEEKRITFGKKNAGVEFAALLRGVNTLPEEELKQMQGAFRVYYRVASQLRNTPLECAIKRVMEHTEDEGTVRQHPNFPTYPPSAYHLFCEKHGCTALQSTASIQRAFKNERDPEVIACRRESEQRRINYLQELKDFLRDHSDSLFLRQTNYVSRKIKRLERAQQQAAGVGTEKGKRKRGEGAGPSPARKKMTPFDFYKQSKRQKWPEMGAEAREAKLRRHFDKLDEDKRLIFEELAANQE